VIQKPKHLTLMRPLAVIDLESTGTDVRNDRIIEIAVVTLFPDGSNNSFVRRVNPEQPIPQAATEVHGIRDCDVAGCPTFAAIAPELLASIDRCDMAGFGIVSFDLPMLIAEFARTGRTFRMSGRAVLDALTIYRRREPRDLTAAVRFYLGTERTAAHTGHADAVSALRVLDAQVSRYGLPRTPAELHTATVEVDLAGNFRRSSEGVVFGFGKHRGRPLARVAADDPDYLRWVLRQSFLDDARALVLAALETRAKPR